ncbi:MAG: DUF5996 family protein [Fimbriimonadales bacterium]
MSAWPALAYEDWKDTCETLHLWTQVVGKIRLAQMPWINHSWHVTFCVTAHGLTTLPMPNGERSLQIDFDFIAHKLLIQTDVGATKTVCLEPKSVSDFYEEVMARLAEVGPPVEINTMPSEIADAIPFDHDHDHASYDPDAANRFWHALLQSDRVFKQFRARFTGKCSPVHFFWGGFDLAVTRFSGRTAPEHPGGVPHLPNWIAREAYSHEVSSCGFWPGNDMLPYPAFYSYAYPEPEGFKVAKVAPPAAIYHPDLKEFIFPYDAVRSASSPDETLLDFLQTTYEAAADSGNWDRAALERRAK